MADQVEEVEEVSFENVAPNLSNCLISYREGLGTSL